MNQQTSSRRRFRVLVASDGSEEAQVAVAAAVHFPWPDLAQVRAVVAHPGDSMFSPAIAKALKRGATVAAQDARRSLSERWPDAEAVVASPPPVKGLLNEARLFNADAIVTGWRGHGAVRRIVTGSVSRSVVRQAGCSVLVARRRMKHAGEIVLGFDGSAEAQQAIQLVSRLSSAGGHVTIVRVAEQMPLPTQALVSSETMAMVREEVKRINAEKLALAQRETARAADLLKEAGWRVRTIVTTGVPLRSLLTTVERMRAGLLVVGARGASGLRHVLLGSVTEGALNECLVSILIAR